MGAVRQHFGLATTGKPTQKVSGSGKVRGAAKAPPVKGKK
jgi:hypothetical protein